MTKRSIVAATAACLLLAVSACGGSASGGDDTDSAADPTAAGTNTSSGSSGEGSTSGKGAALPTKKCPPVVKSQINSNATFTWTYTVPNTSFDPDKITTSNSQMYLYPVYDSLIYLDSKGNPQPMLAKDWSIGNGGKSMTLHLIKDYQYHDGTPFDAQSVKANLERHRAEGSFNEQALSDITNIEVKDKYTITITTKHGAAPLVGVLASSAGMMMSPKVFDDPSQERKPTGGSGPFTVVKYEPGSRVVYKAYKDYWDPDLPRVQKMVFLISSDDNARLNGVITGQSDATFLRASMYSAAKSSGMTVCQTPSQQAYMIALNVAHKPLGNVKVRKAMNYAVDREAVSALTKGFGTPGVQLYSTDYWAANPQLTADKYERNIEKAKQLLKEAGYPDGFSFTLETDNLASYQRVAQLIQANLKDVGIDMKIVPVELTKLLEDFSVKKTADAVLIQEKATPDPSLAIGSFYIKNGFNNPGGYSNDKITKLWNKAKAASTLDDRAKIYQKLFHEAYVDAAPTIVLVHMTTPMILRNDVMGFHIWFDGQRKFRGVAIKK